MKKLYKITAIALMLIVAVICNTADIFAVSINGTIYGNLSGQGKIPVAGATIRLSQSQVMAISDKNGKFTAELQTTNDEMIISLMGYMTQTITVNNKSQNLEIFLENDESIKTDMIEVVETRDAMIAETDLYSTTTLSTTSLRKAACCNLSESFETTAAVDVSYADAVSGAKQIAMLGLKGTYVQMLTDKTPNLRGLATPFGLSYIPSNWLNTISISKGASSVSTGHESITGQINVDYKKPETSEKFFVNLFLKSVGEMDFNTNALINVTDTLKTELYFQTNHNILSLDDNDDGFLDMALNSKYNLMNRWFYQKKKTRTMFGFQILDDKRTGGQTTYIDDKDNPELYGMEYNTRRFELFGKQALLFDNNKAFRSIALIGSATWHDQDAMFGHRDYEAEQTTGYLNAIYDHATKDNKHIFDAGLSLEYDQTKEKLTDPDFENEYINNREYIVPGAFAEYTLGIIPDVRIIGGLRADYDMKNEDLYLVPRVHAKWELYPGWHLRGSFGRGWRHAYALAENTAMLASSREILFDEEIKAEDAWNYGINILTEFTLFDRAATFSVEYFRTDFTNRLITDLDANTSQIRFYNLDGKSFSNSVQVDLTIKPIKRFVVTTAYRYNDVRMTYKGSLEQKPLASPHRGFINLEYATDFRVWTFDFTANYISSGRLPDTGSNPAEYQLPENYDGYFLLNAQIARDFGDFNVYLGVENLTGYTQENPILAADTPYGQNFDSSIIYAPITGRKLYMKFIYELW